MSSIDQQVASQLANIERATGRTLAEWIELINASGLARHGQVVTWLKSEHGLGHGNANLLAHRAREAESGGRPPDAALVDTHYSGRNAPLRPLYDAVVAHVHAMGSDIELAPKKAYVSLRRRKQFAQVGPAAGQLEVCLNLPGHPAGARLTATTGMATHKVRLSSPAQIDAELIGWLREAYDRAG